MVKNLIVLQCLFSTIVFAQVDSTESKISRKWYLPDGATVQYAGGFGMLSAGVIYQPTSRIETAITMGYTPPAYGKVWTTNFFGSYTFIKYQPCERISFNLLKAGAFVNLNFGKNIYLNWPDRYGDYYYWWNSSMRFGPFLDTELKYSPSKGPVNYVFSLQCNTNDLYLASYFPNYRTLEFHEILVLGFGVKILFKDKNNWHNNITVK
jgi:hypothetical protein